MATARKFSDAVLKHLQTQHAESSFTATFVNGYWRSPRFSLRRQAELRKACVMRGVDPVSIGLPEPAPHKVMQKKPPKGHKQQREYQAKQEKIQKNMREMPAKIRDWKQGLAKELEKSKPSLPF
ncbi:hypothetical protein H4S02_005761 [Coemansia sp. RSA 2611]|nr:hypothetical protein H4S01_003471 [Coemansia sp. RSA 2610]KAJ2382412.1 hypothetical protein H4S02_005761 [Coemansia sp. RSA 2611]